MNRVVDRASNILISYQENIESLKKWFLVGIISSALLSSLLIGISIYCFLPFIKKQEIIQTLKAVKEVKSRKQRSSSVPPQLPVKNKKNS